MWDCTRFVTIGDMHAWLNIKDVDEVIKADVSKVSPACVATKDATKIYICSLGVNSHGGNRCFRRIAKKYGKQDRRVYYGLCWEPKMESN
jgi:hypothetical protein